MRGFTLIELLVVIAIIAVLVIIAVPNYNAYNQAQKLNDSAAQLQSAIRNAQNNAITGTICKANTSAGKWSVNFTNSNTQYNISSTCKDDGTSSVAVTYNLPSGVIFKSVALSKADGSIPCAPSYSDTIPLLDFKAISGEVDFKKFTCSADDIMTITLQNENDVNKTRSVVVEKGGGVYVK